MLVALTAIIAIIEMVIGHPILHSIVVEQYFNRIALSKLSFEL